MNLKTRRDSFDNLRKHVITRWMKLNTIAHDYYFDNLKRKHAIT